MRQICFTLTRSLVIVVNLIVTVLAALLIYISFTAFDNEYDSFVMNEQTHPKLIHSYITILCSSIGLIVVLLSLLGFIGAIKKSETLLALYTVIVLLMVSLLFVLILLTYSMNNTISTHKEVDKSFVNSTLVVYNYVDTGDVKTRIIDNIQRSFSCCGVNSPNDWAEYSLQKIPRSCCTDPVESSLPVFKYCAESDHKVGCWRALMEHFHANIASVRSVLYIFVAFGLVCALAAGFIIIALKHDFDVV